jgi:hypothetical protein
MEALLEAADKKDANAILEALEKVEKAKEEKKLKPSVNLLGKKSGAPQGGLSTDVEKH